MCRMATVKGLYEVEYYLAIVSEKKKCCAVEVIFKNNNGMTKYKCVFY